jgi:AraC family transcriptional regulator, regulatory protein of adaptative response / methylated-DNA-[protein]-cysteine methyltransferase
MLLVKPVLHLPSPIKIDAMRSPIPQASPCDLVEEETYWQAVLDRDPEFDGKVFYGVRSTGIYCRPTCPSRRPNRDQIAWFVSPTQAEAQGFRACKRCQPQIMTAIDPVRDKVLAACRYIEAQTEHIPTLLELSHQVALSPSHLQRVFKQMVGVSPFQYGMARRTERLKQQLNQGEAITAALYDAGYGSSSRLYETAPTQLGMTPATYQRQGSGESIRYATVSSPLGIVLVAATDRGLCSVRLGETAAELERELHQEFRHASLQPTDPQLQAWMQALVDYLSGDRPLPDLPFDVKATAFQRQVWQVLQQIPIGSTVSYSEVAGAIGRPTSVRAVARACATNPVALVIPCHRVIPKTGGFGGYRWGIARKKALLDLEKHPEKHRPT